MYDIIGDIHGHHTKLTALLSKLGYQQRQGIWTHPTRKVIFVGDYIDRGPAIRETLHTVRKMVDAGSAIALLGNHEYNALAYDYQHEDGNYLRSHNSRHTKQHQATLTQFENYGEEWRSFINWFYELPLFLDLDNLRVVHACWDIEHIAWLKANGHRIMNKKLLLESHDKSNIAYQVIEETLKGKEVDVGEENLWYDKDGTPRTANRYKWWIEPMAGCFGDFLFDCPPGIENKPVDMKVEMYPKEDPPVFFGHYWLTGSTPAVQATNIICLDYSVAKNGSLVAYRWNKGEPIDNKHFVYVS